MLAREPVTARTIVDPFRVIAHRGLAESAPGNTMAAFAAAQEAGADGIEIDIRLTCDGTPIVHHHWYLNEDEPDPVPIHALTAADLQGERVRDPRPEWSRQHPIPTLAEVLERFGGRMKLEIELKSPELELVDAAVSHLAAFHSAWPMIEFTSSSTSLLSRVREIAPDLSTALLLGTAPRYMRGDVIGYVAVQMARQAGTRIVHLDRATQLSEPVLAQLRDAGIEAHVYPVNGPEDMELAARFGVPEVVTDDLRNVLAARSRAGQSRPPSLP